ncbi:MAG: SGNH hydrolase domain-containing protein [Ilumatobacteraceae bacterium]
MSHRCDIEGLRAVAVVAVLLFHFGVPGTSGGFVGVDVFFVISGFLITSLLIAERERSGTVSILRFYARRARRLLPISTVVLATTAVAASRLLDPTRLDDLVAELRASALFGANLLFAHRGTDYLTASLEPSPVLHFWSLAVEEQFYLVWPALIAAITVTASRSQVRHRTAAAMCLVVAASYCMSGFLTAGNPPWSYYGLHTRAWELGLGALLAAMAPAASRLPTAIRASAGWAGLAAVVGSVVFLGSAAEFPGWIAMVPVSATVLVLASGEGDGDAPWGPAWLLRRQPLQYLGSRSYSLYLWHWPALVLAEAHRGAPLPASWRIVLLAGTVLAAEAGYRIVEHPIRSSGWLSSRPAWSVAMGGVLVAAAIGSTAVATAASPDLRTGLVAKAPSIVTSTTQGPATTPDPAPSSSAAVPTTEAAPPAALTMAGQAAPQAVVDALAPAPLPDNVRPPVLNAKNDVPSIYDDGCHQYLSPRVTGDCAFGDEDGIVTVALWGDSHAAQWFTPLERIAIERGWRLLSLTQGGCPFLDVPVYNFGAAAEFPHCQPWRDDVRRFMRDEGVDIVLVSQYHRLAEADSRDPIGLDRWQQLLPTLLDSLRADGIEPIVIGDTPRPDRSAPACAAENRSDLSRCAIRLDDTRVNAIDEWVRSATAARSVGYVEPAAWVCSNGVCPIVVGDILAYRDESHISNEFASWLQPLLDAMVGTWVDAFAAYQRSA